MKPYKKKILCVWLFGLCVANILSLTSKKSYSQPFDGSMLNLLRKSNLIREPAGAENRKCIN